MTIPEGTYLFSHYHFGGTEFAPQLALRKDENVHHLTAQQQALTLDFDTTTRYCTGWHDLATGETHPCPHHAVVTRPYHECRECQQKTGFNPAFYHSDTVSTQQQARNQQPHLLYLAHFGSQVIKVGISWAERDIRRLLDQGARSCLILGIFPNAEIARQYEAAIAKLPGIAETLQVRQKLQLLHQPYDAKQAAAELIAARIRIDTELGLTFDESQPQYLDAYYLNNETLHAGRLVDLAGETKISGALLGMIGSTLIALHDDTQYLLNISKFRGYPLTIHYKTEVNQHAPQQASLF